MGDDKKPWMNSGNQVNIQQCRVNKIPYKVWRWFVIHIVFWWTLSTWYSSIMGGKQLIIIKKEGKFVTKLKKGPLQRFSLCPKRERSHLGYCLDVLVPKYWQYKIDFESIYLFFLKFTKNNAKIQRQKPTQKKNTSVAAQTEAYLFFNVAHIYSQLQFFWSSLTVSKTKHTTDKHQSSNI